MILPAYNKVQTDDKELDKAQDAIGKSIAPLLANPLMTGQLVEKVSLVVGTNRIPHKLGRKLTGWMITRQRGPVTPTKALTDWTSYALTIGGSTTAPGVSGTIALNEARYRQVGDSIEILFNYRHTAATTGGSGTYLFPLPSGLTIDSSKFTVGDFDGDHIVGSAAANNGTTTGTGYVYAYNSTNLAMYLGTDTVTPQRVGSSWFVFTQAAIRLSLRAVVPITGLAVAGSSFIQAYDAQDTEVLPDKFLKLVSSGAGVVDIFCF